MHACVHAALIWLCQPANLELLAVRNMHSTAAYPACSAAHSRPSYLEASALADAQPRLIAVVHRVAVNQQICRATCMHEAHIAIQTIVGRRHADPNAHGNCSKALVLQALSMKAMLAARSGKQLELHHPV
jgi:hypothetical protein